MKKFVFTAIILLVAVTVIISISYSQFSNKEKNLNQIPSPSIKTIKTANFDSENNLIRPEDYRKWIFVGSSLGLSYRPNPTTGKEVEELFHNTYIHPDAYNEFSRSGKFPEGTMFVLELLTQEKKNEPGLQGSYEKDLVAIEASVKDSKRFKDGWAYFSFDGEDGKFLNKAKAFESNSCFACHDKKAETDHVFTQFYPVLRSLTTK